MPLRYVLQFTVISFVSQWLRIFPHLAYKLVTLAARRKPKSTIANILAGICAQRLKKPNEALHFWKLGYGESFDLGILSFPGHSISDYVELLLQACDYATLKKAAEAYLRGHFDMRRLDPAPVLSALYKMDPQGYEAFLHDVEIKSTPIITTLNVVPIDQHALSSKVTAAETVFEFEDPDVFERPDLKRLRHLTIPEQKVHQVADVEIVEGFQVLKDQNLLLYEDGGHPSQNWVAGLWQNYRHIEGQHRDEVLRFSHRNPTRTVDEGVLLSGRASFNYFHWMIEYIPRLLDVENAGLAKSIPLIIQNNLPRTMRDALAAINPGFDILEVDPKHETLVVQTLWVPTFSTCVPDDFAIPFWRGARVSKAHMTYVRERVFSSIKLPKLPPRRKVFIGRRGGRGLENAAEIETFMGARGFEVIFPETLSFAQQVELFHSAAIIVAVSGAALTNVLFMQPGSRVVAMTSERNTGYAMNANVAKLFGVMFEYVAGPNVRPRESYANEAEFVHSNFTIDRSMLSRALDRFAD